VSAFGALGKGEVGYFKMVNERGGINGRKVNLISLDDSYAPPKTVEQTRRLIESDEVALIFSSTGTAHNTAIAKYLQGKNMPQLFLASGASKFADVTGDADRHGLQGVRTAGLPAAGVPAGRPCLTNRRDPFPLRALCNVMRWRGRDTGKRLSCGERISSSCFSSCGRKIFS